MKLYLDTETYSETDIKAGPYRYAEDPACEITLVSYALDDGPEKIWDATSGRALPDDLHQALDSDCPIVLHNSMFDRTVARVTGFLKLNPERIIDTMVQAYSHGLPGGLDKLCTIFGLPEDKAKLKTGRQLVMFFCKPNKGVRHTQKTHPEKWEEFMRYAVRDITAMRIIHAKLPTWNYPGPKFPAEPSDEHRLWVLDQKINDRGFQVDVELAQAAVAASEAEKKILNDATSAITAGEVTAATQRDKLLGFILAEYGVTLPDMRADTLQRRIEDENLPLELRQLLDLRVQSGRNSASKYKVVLKAAGADGRMRGCLQFCGAPTTGRWSGKLFQPQNCMRPTMKLAQINEAIRDIKSGAVTLAYNNVPEVLGNCVRGVIIAPPGKKLVAADLKSIEGRGLAYLAGDERVVQFYHDFDCGKVDYDSYMLAYSMCFGVPPEAVEKWQRQIGKPIELGFGYGGGVGAFLTFALTYHLDLDKLADTIWEIGDQDRLRECQDKHGWAKENGYHAGMGARKYAAFEYVKQRWREARVPTTRFWEQLAEGFKMAALYPDKTFTAGPIKFRRGGQWLRMRLPSGRYLIFLQPRLDEKGLSYLGLDRYTRKLGRVYTHGGKLAGIATQAFAADVMRHSMPLIEAGGFEIVLGVHDEVVTEASPDRTVAELCELFTVQKPWAPGLPLAADGFEALRYRKDD